jgi:dienelactone hydrolase
MRAPLIIAAILFCVLTACSGDEQEPLRNVQGLAPATAVQTSTSPTAGAPPATASPTQPAATCAATTYQSEGTPIPASLCLPAQTAPRPAVVYLHGSAGPMEAPAGIQAELARQGFVVLAPAYFTRTPAPGPRPGDFSQAGAGRREVVTEAARVWQQVIADGVSYLQQHPRVNREQIATIGHSLGAAVGLRAATEDTRVKAMVAIAGPRELPSFPAFSALMNEFDQWAARLPHTLIVQGDADTTVTVAQAEQIQREIAATGRPQELAVIPGGDHFLNGSAGRTATARITTYLQARFGS